MQVSPEGHTCPPGSVLKRQTAHVVAPVASQPAFTADHWDPMPSITDGHSLFATSSAHCTMARACAWVAYPWGSRRCIGFTSFPKMPSRSADRQMGLGTHYPPKVVAGSGAKYMTLAPKTSCLLATAPSLRKRQALAVQFLRWFKREFTLHFPYPIRQRPNHLLLGGFWTRSRVPSCACAQDVYLQLRTPGLLQTHVQVTTRGSTRGSVENKTP